MTWSRLDELGVKETVVDFGNLSVLTQTRSVGRRADVGEEVTVAGWLSAVGDYEWEFFELPDVRREWRVRSVRRVISGDHIIAADPVT